MKPKASHVHLYTGPSHPIWEDALAALRSDMIRASLSHRTIELAEVMVYVRSTSAPERLYGLSFASYSHANTTFIPIEIEARLAHSRARYIGLVDLAKRGYLAPDAPASDPDRPSLADGD